MLGFYSPWDWVLLHLPSAFTRDKSRMWSEQDELSEQGGQVTTGSQNGFGCNWKEVELVIKGYSTDYGQARTAWKLCQHEVNWHFNPI